MHNQPQPPQPELPGYVVRYANTGAQRGWLASEDATGERCVVRCVASTGRTIADVGPELPHRIPVRDLRRTERGDDLVIIEDFVDGRILSEVLRAASLSPGQIVTLVVPLLETCAALASLSLVPATLEPTDVIVDVTGRARIANDVALLAYADQPEQLEQLAAVSTLLARLPDSLVRPGLDAAALAAHLVLSCEPQVVDVGADLEPYRTPPIRLNPIEFDSTLEVDALEKPNTRGVLALVRSLPRLVRARWLSDPETHRLRKLAFAGALSAALIAISLVAIPTTQADSAEAPSPTESKTPEPTTPKTAAEGDWGDVASAAVALITTRATCGSAHEAAECLERADEEASPQFREDDERIKSAQTLRFSDATNVSSELVSAMGQAALLRVRAENATASVLLVQTEAGWRIRELFD